jgi:hypothetical protein
MCESAFISLSLYSLRPILDDRLGKRKECQRYNYKTNITDESNRKAKEYTK